MADPAVVHQDIALFLVGWYRAWLGSRDEPFLQGFTVDIVEPAKEPFPNRLLVIRDDGGTDTSIVTNERSIGMTVLAGSKQNPHDANDAARLIHAARLLIPSPAPTNPVAAVLQSTTPVEVTEKQDRARRYMTLVLSVVGSAL